MKQLVIIDESPVILKKIVSYFSGKENVEVLASVANIQEFREVLKMKSPSLPDIVLLSTLMGTIMRDEIAEHVQKICPSSVIINYNIFNNGQTLVISANKGSLSFGENTFAFSILDMVVKKVENDSLRSHSISGSNDFESDEGKKMRLTYRQQEVVIGLMRGLSYDEIAKKMSISINTVRLYIKEIYKTFEVKNKVQLINKFTYRNEQSVNLFSSCIPNTNLKMA